MNDDDQPDDVVSLAGAAPILGVNRSRTYELSRRADFPDPVAETPLGRLWRRSDIVTYAANRKEQTT
jgi:predicted DNA-binding transcriptional regulator AlpA